MSDSSDDEIITVKRTSRKAIIESDDDDSDIESLNKALRKNSFDSDDEEDDEINDEVQNLINRVLESNSDNDDKENTPAPVSITPITNGIKHVSEKDPFDFYGTKINPTDNKENEIHEPDKSVKKPVKHRIIKPVNDDSSDEDNGSSPSASSAHSDSDSSSNSSIGDMLQQPISMQEDKNDKEYHKDVGTVQPRETLKSRRTKEAALVQIHSETQRLQREDQMNMPYRQANQAKIANFLDRIGTTKPAEMSFANKFNRASRRNIPEHLLNTLPKQLSKSKAVALAASKRANVRLSSKAPRVPRHSELPPPVLSRPLPPLHAPSAPLHPLLAPLPPLLAPSVSTSADDDEGNQSPASCLRDFSDLRAAIDLDPAPSSITNDFRAMAVVSTAKTTADETKEVGGTSDSGIRMDEPESISEQGRGGGKEDEMTNKEAGRTDESGSKAAGVGGVSDEDTPLDDLNTSGHFAEVNRNTDASIIEVSSPAPRGHRPTPAQVKSHAALDKLSRQLSLTEPSLQETPTLGGWSEGFIEFDEAVQDAGSQRSKATKGIDLLLSRSIRHGRLSNVNGKSKAAVKKSFEISTVVKSAEGDKLELDTFTYDVNNFDSVNEPTTCDGVLPGGKLVKLKEQLQEKMKKKRAEVRRSRIADAKFNEEESYGGEDEEEAEFTDSEDEDGEARRRYLEEEDSDSELMPSEPEHDDTAAITESEESEDENDYGRDERENNRQKKSAFISNEAAEDDTSDDEEDDEEDDSRMSPILDNREDSKDVANFNLFKGVTHSTPIEKRAFASITRDKLAETQEDTDILSTPVDNNPDPLEDDHEELSCSYSQSNSSSSSYLPGSMIPAGQTLTLSRYNSDEDNERSTSINTDTRSQDDFLCPTFNRSFSGIKKMFSRVSTTFSSSPPQQQDECSQLLDEDGMLRGEPDKHESVRRELQMDTDISQMDTDVFRGNQIKFDSTSADSTQHQDLMALCSGVFPNTAVSADVTAAPDTFVDETSNNSDFMVQSNKPKLGHMRIIDSDSDDDDSHTEIAQPKMKVAVISDDDDDDDDEAAAAGGEDVHNGEAEDDDEAEQNKEQVANLFRKAFNDGTSKLKSKIKLKDYFEDEAELSGSEDSDDELESDKRLDNYEIQSGDEEELVDDEHQMEQIERAHLANLMNDDMKEIRHLQERLLPDADLHTDSVGRQRKFRWKNIDEPYADGMKPDSDEEEDGVGGSTQMSQDSWRVERHEREKFLRDQQQARPGKEEQKKEMKDFKFTCKNSSSLSNNKVVSSDSAKTKDSSLFKVPKSTFGSLFNMNRKSMVKFSGEGTGASSSSGAPSSAGKSSAGGRFTFNVLTPPKTGSKTALMEKSMSRRESTQYNDSGKSDGSKIRRISLQSGCGPTAKKPKLTSQKSRNSIFDLI